MYVEILRRMDLNVRNSEDSEWKGSPGGHCTKCSLDTLGALAS